MGASNKSRSGALEARHCASNCLEWSLLEDRGHPLREIAATSEDILGFVSLETNETLMAEVLERAHYLITIVAAA